MRIKLIYGILILMVSSCMVSSKFNVTRVGEEPQNYTERYVYSLPRTVVWVKLNYKKESYIPGPYRMYSQKYLGLTDFIDKFETKWKIIGAEMSSFSEPDPMHYYSINLIKGDIQSIPFLDLGQEGLILDPGKRINLGSEAMIMDDEIKPPYFTDLSQKSNFVEKQDTMFKTIIQDTSFITIPILRKQRDAKTLEQKAEEAANFIIKIRKRRFKLEAGDYDVFPEGTALETAIRELNKLEKEYLSLFVGKIFTENYSRSFFITPSGTKENLTFLRFSGSKGLLPADSPEGEAVILQLDPLGNTDILKKRMSQIPEAGVFNSLYYRLPEVTSVLLMQNDKLLYESRFTVYQAGSLVSLPLITDKISKAPWYKNH